MVVTRAQSAAASHSNKTSKQNSPSKKSNAIGLEDKVNRAEIALSAEDISNGNNKSSWVGMIPFLKSSANVVKEVEETEQIDQIEKTPIKKPIVNDWNSSPVVSTKSINKNRSLLDERYNDEPLFKDEFINSNNRLPNTNKIPIPVRPTKTSLFREKKAKENSQSNDNTNLVEAIKRNSNIHYSPIKNDPISIAKEHLLKSNDSNIEAQYSKKIIELERELSFMKLEFARKESEMISAWENEYERRVELEELLQKFNKLSTDDDINNSNNNSNKSDIFIPNKKSNNVQNQSFRNDNSW